MSLSDEELAEQYPSDPTPHLNEAARELYEAALTAMSWGHHEQCDAVRFTVDGKGPCDCGYDALRVAVKKARDE